MSDPTIIYTYTDEAPALATHSFLPILEAFAGAAGIPVDTRDISLAARILAVFPDRLTEEQRVPDALAELGELARTPEANIIKLPNISASIPQMKACIKELQAQGYDLPDYPDEPTTDEQREAKARYDAVKGSAVNPVLREGNSDRRAPKAVKEYARKNPHSMGAWSSESRSHVATMDEGDFRSNEVSVTMPAADTLRIELVGADGSTTVLKDGLAVQAGEVIDASFMSKSKLVEFLAAQVEDAKQCDVLFSLHMKATMMKVSDPVIFGHGVRAFFAGLFEELGDELADPADGLAAVLKSVEALPDDRRARADELIAQAYEQGPRLAMVDSDRGITNLHVPSDVIIDASMPAAIRTSGQMWDADGEQQDAKFVIPDSSYAALYAETVEHCKQHGAFDPRTMGSVSNVGLMAQKAEEYGSHDKTFEIPLNGTVRVLDADGRALMEHRVEQGDI
ncbi:MAG: NADP-dependent isocitrate dehydrogenase, partial [Actinomycetes bacterium]